MALFITQHGIQGTPAFFVLSPATGDATEPDAMTLQELIGFLERGARAMKAPAKAPLDAALARGDELLARNDAAAAAIPYSEALGLAPKLAPHMTKPWRHFSRPGMGLNGGTLAAKWL